MSAETHAERARAFLDRLGRELPLPAGEIEMLAGLLREVERETLARAAGECRRRAEEQRAELAKLGTEAARRANVWAEIQLGVVAEAIEAMGANNAVDPRT